MSEQDEQPPLTRRERRLREMAETGALDLSELAAAEAGTSRPGAPESADTGDAAAAGAAATDADEIEISPFNEDGTPRSRREIRRLREEALAARAAEEEASAGDAEVAEPEVAEAEADETAGAEGPAETEVAEPAETEVAETVEVVEADETADAEGPAETEAVVVEAATEESGGTEEPAEAEAVEAEAVPEAGETTAVAEAPTAEPDFDTLISPPTEAFTVEELREAERSTEGEETQTAAVAEPEPLAEADGRAGEAAGAQAEAEEAHAETASEKPKRRFWQRNKNAESTVAGPAEEPPAPDAQAAPAEVAEETPTAEAAEEAPTAEAVASQPAPLIPQVPAPADEPAAELPGEQSGGDDAPADREAETSEGSEAGTTYSFPDIVPPEEWRSVFDDHSTRTVGGPEPKPVEDFDDLISRTVSDEGSTGGTGTSALILPSLPEDTGGLTGPLGGTGELFVTGSLNLPKSISETGGHAALHDSIELDPIFGKDGRPEMGVGDGPAPVSARHAVSARATEGMSVVAKPARERSKLPLVLSITGGSLLVVVVGLGIWAWSSGMFG